MNCYCGKAAEWTVIHTYHIGTCAMGVEYVCDDHNPGCGALRGGRPYYTVRGIHNLKEAQRELDALFESIYS